MTTKRVTKLLAVVALTTSPVAADPAPRAPVANRAPAVVREMGSDPGSRTPAADPWAGAAIVGADPWSSRPAQPAAPTFSLTGLVELIVQPRTMPSGAPACGNVASRAPRPADCVRRRP